MNKQPLLTKNDWKKFGILLLNGVFFGAIMYVGMYLLAPDSITKVYLLAVASVIVGFAAGNMVGSTGIFKLFDEDAFKKDEEVKAVNEIVDTVEENK